MPGLDSNAGYAGADQTQDPFSDMRLIGTGAGNQPRKSPNGRMVIDANGVERFPTPVQQQIMTQQGDLNAPPPGQMTTDQQNTQIGAPTPGQFSYQRAPVTDGGNGNGTG